VDLAAERALGELLRLAFAAGWVCACHDLAEGGLLVALAEMAFAHGLGCSLRTSLSPLGLFSESQGRAVMTVGAHHDDELLRAAERRGVVAERVGEVGGDEIRVRFEGGMAAAAVERLHEAWRSALPRALAV
jgi:phosphoribosylformylglycinamidine synthase